MNTDVARLRQEYLRASFDEKDATRDPFEQFRVWFDAALLVQPEYANAMTLATASAVGQPSARIVLLKGYDQRGFVFYTNTRSRKARELTENPAAALLFFWPELEREVRIEGRIEAASNDEADNYFASRPLGSRHAAIASPQSEIVADRNELEKLFSAAEKRSGSQPQRPDYWGGYRLLPRSFEFWQGRANRLHDRLLYTTTESSDWKIQRLAP